MKKVLILRSIACAPDPRVEKIALSLSKYYEVNVLAWDREGIHGKREEGRYKIERLKLKAPYGSFKLFFYLILWNGYEFYYLLTRQYDIIHACNLDTVIPAYIVAKVRRKKLVYDIFDFYADTFPINSPRILLKSTTTIERYIIKHVNLTLIVDDSRYQQIGNANKNVIVIMNTSVDNVLISEKNNEGDFLIFYAGILSETRSLIEMAMAVEQLKTPKLVLAGFGDGLEMILTKIETYNSTKFIGKISHDEVIENSRKSNLLFAIYNPEIPNHKFSSANKLFEAMMLSKPVIVAKGTSMDKIVESERCGLVVKYGDIEQLKQAILTLMNNPEMAKELGHNGRRAFERSYNWEIMEQRLLKSYSEL